MDALTKIVLKDKHQRRKAIALIKVALSIEAQLRAREEWLQEVIEKDLNVYEAQKLWITKYPKRIKEIYKELCKEATKISKLPVEPHVKEPSSKFPYY